MARKKPEGIETLKAKQDPVSIQEITLLDWYAAFLMMGQPVATAEDMHGVFEIADLALQERARRMPHD